MLLDDGPAPADAGVWAITSLFHVGYAIGDCLRAWALYAFLPVTHVRTRPWPVGSAESIVERLCDNVMLVTLELLFDTRGSNEPR